MAHTNPKVNFYFQKEKRWHAEIALLRKIALGTGLSEELKWGCPCYTREGANITLIHTFKDYCALLFFQGALLPDPDGVLVQQTKNVQAARQLRFTGLEEVRDRTAQIGQFIREAIKAEQAGLKVELKETGEFEMPEEFRESLEQVPGLKEAFGALTPGRQRGYLLHFSAAKQEKTRLARIEKYIPAILSGKGIND